MTTPVSHPCEIECQDRQKLLQRGSGYVFLFSFLLVTLIGVFVQKLFLPVMLPQLHAGHGLLLGGDWVGFHEDGAKLADLIAAKGWGSFELRPGGNAPVAISALAYYFTGVHEPWVLVPINAAIFALGAVGLFNIFDRIADTRLAVVALIPYLLFPSSVQLYSQIHKDVWAITGFVGLVFVWTVLADMRRISSGQFFGLIAIAALASAFAWLVRPYLSGVYLGALVCGTAFLFVWTIAKRATNVRAELRRWTCLGLCIVAVGVFAFGVPSRIFPSLSETAAPDLFGTVRHAPPRLECERKPNSLDSAMPSMIRRGLDSIINVRVGQRGGGLKAGSAIDHDTCFSQPSDVLFYIPRSLQVGLFAPFPDMWFSSGVSPGARAMRSVAGLEMLASYVLLPGIPVLLVLAGFKRRKLLLLGLIVTLPLICLLSTTIPNVGTLYRMRYGYLQFLLGLGIIGWGCAWRIIRVRLGQWLEQRSILK